MALFHVESRQDSALNLTTSTNGTSSISMSVELNGVVYTGRYRCRAPQEVQLISSCNVSHHSESKDESCYTLLSLRRKEWDSSSITYLIVKISNITSQCVFNASSFNQYSDRNIKNKLCCRVIILYNVID